MRGIGIFAVLAGVSSAGCAGGSAGRTMPSAQQPPNKVTESARFEAFRAATEQQVRRSAPAGFEVSVGSTYLVKRSGNVIVFTDRNVAMKTASAIGVRVGSQTSVYARSDVTEIPKSFFQSAPRSRQVSEIGCTTDGCPDPPPPPDPTPPPDGTDGGSTNFSGSTAQADTLAATRQAPCTESVTTNGYPGATMSYVIAGINTWTLQYRAGYPYYTGGTDSADITTAVRLVDGSTQQSVYSKLIANGSTSTTEVTYNNDIRKVKYASIQVIDHVYPGDNLIMGLANVSCPADSEMINKVAPFPPPPPPPFHQWWQPIGPT